MLYIRSPKLTYFIIENLYSLKKKSPFPQSKGIIMCNTNNASKNKILLQCVTNLVGFIPPPHTRTLFSFSGL